MCNYHVTVPVQLKKESDRSILDTGIHWSEKMD